MPFAILHQTVTRAAIFIILLSAEMFGPIVVTSFPNNYWFYIAAMLLTAVIFVAISYIENGALVRDMQELCLYEFLVYGAGLVCFLLGIKPASTVASLMTSFILLRFGRLLWSAKSQGNKNYAAWPVFGVLGILARRKKLAIDEEEWPSAKQTWQAYCFIVLALALGFFLNAFNLFIQTWQIGVVFFLVTTLVAKRVLTDMQHQHAAYLKSVDDANAARERAASEQARADAQQEIAAEKERYNQHLAAKNAELEQANVKIQALLAVQVKDKALHETFNEALRDASHDLQHPMAVVRIHADTLKAMVEEEFWDKEKWRSVAQMLDIAMEEMTEMIDATVHSAQVVTGVVKPDVRVIDMNALLKKFNQLWLNGDNRRSLDYMLTYPTRHAGLYCPFDVIILKRILRNLIANAIQHSASDKGVLLALRRRAGRCIIEVRDTGPGIPEGLGPDKLANFIAFANRIRAEGSQVKQSGSRSGYRLGMSNVLQLCAATGLEMQLCTITGRGSKFSFSLPLASAEQFIETIQIRKLTAAQWEEASDLLQAFADLPMPDEDFFPKDEDLKRHKLMPNSSNGVAGTPV